MIPFRLIARLDIKGPNLIKGICLEGLRVVGNPGEFALEYYRHGVDEILYMDAVAALYGRNSLGELLRSTARNIFVPITVGGGIRSVDDVRAMLRCGADKVAVNTAAIANPALIEEIAETFGSQCMVLSIEAKRRASGEGWEVYAENGREHTGRDVVDWARQAVDLGAGEILLTSVDRDGTCKGFDVDLVRDVCRAVPVPVIASGGMGSPEHLLEVVRNSGTSAVATASALHYRRCTLDDARSSLAEAGISIVPHNRLPGVDAGSDG